MFSVSRNIVKFRTSGEIAFFSKSISSARNKIKNKYAPTLIDYKDYKIINQIIPARTLCSKQPVLLNESQHNSQHNEIDYNIITGGDKDLEHKLKIIMLEAEVLRQEGKLVPDNEFLSEKHWKELLALNSRSRRQKYFEYLFKLSKTKENRHLKKIEKRLAFEEFRSTKEERKLSLEEHASRYDLQHNNLFLRIYDSTINQMYHNKLIQNMQFGEKLVIDCGYEQNMTKRENINCAKQFMLVFSENRYHEDSFDIHFCNADLPSTLITSLHKHIPTMYDPWFPINIHEESYLDIFPKEKLVYLTPHCQEEMKEYESDVIYIIGGIVDKVNCEPLSLAKAKKEGIRMQKFPLDRYLQWGSGSGKSLTINQSVSIMLDLKKTKDWDYALRHVPRRKLITRNLRQNIDEATDNLRYDKVFKVKRWIPAPREEIKDSKQEGSRMVSVKSIWDS